MRSFYGSEADQFLKKDGLSKIKASSGGWDILFYLSDEKNYWELTFPHGYMHGGGPCLITEIDFLEAQKKYQLPDVE